MKYVVLYYVCVCDLFYSFVRLCDYLVITMLHRMSVFSAEVILLILEDQTSQIIHVEDIVQPIPESTEEQEKLLRVSFSMMFLLG